MGFPIKNDRLCVDKILRCISENLPYLNMTRFIYDQFTKEYLPELLQPYGIAKASAKVRAEIKEIGGCIMAG